MMARLLWSNPLIRRYRCSLFRPAQLWIYLTIYVSVVLLLLLVNGMSRRLDDSASTSTDFYRRLYAQFLLMEVALLWVWATFNSASTLKGEVLNRTYDFFRLLPLSALQKTCGILLGANLLALLFAAASLLPILLFGRLGQVPLSVEGQVLLLVFAVALFTNSVVVLSSGTASPRQAQTSTTVRILLLVFVGPLLLSPIFALVGAASQVHKAQDYHIAFYGAKVPALLLVGLLALYFGIWNVLGIVRKFTFEAEPLFSRMAALLFLLGYEIIALGLFLPYLPDSRGVVYPMWLLTSLTPVWLIPLGALRTFDGYLERCDIARLRRESSVHTPAGTLLLSSNLTLTAGLFLLWAIFAMLAGLANRMNLAQLTFETAALLSFCLVLLLLLELYVVYQPLYAKIGVLLAFVAILCLILPPILAATFDAPQLQLYSLFGFFVVIVDPLDRLRGMTGVSIFLVNALLCLAPAWLIWKRYARIPQLRQELTGTAPTDSAQRVP